MDSKADGKKSEIMETPLESSVDTRAGKGGTLPAARNGDSANRTAPDEASGGKPAITTEKKNEEGEGGRFVLEQPLLTIKEVFVYRVPPLRASSGHRAEEWGLANPVFTGILKAAQVGDTCCLRLFKPPPEGELGASPELFAESEVRLEKGRTLQAYVEPVIDSSRYFVLRCEDKVSGRHAYVGIGFRERSSAFDLKAVLDDFVRFIDRQNRAAEASAAEKQQQEKQGGETGPVKQMKDLSIAEGQKVHLELKVGSNGSSRPRRRPRSEAPSSGGALLLPPPPMAGVTYKAGATSIQPGLTIPPSPDLALPRQTAPSEFTPSQSPVADLGGRVLERDLSSAGSYAQNEREGEVVGLGVAGEHTGDVDGRDGNQANDDDHGDHDHDDDDGWGEFESA